MIKSRRMGWAEHVARVREREKSRIQGLLRKAEVKNPLGITRLRWENNIKKDLQEVGCGGMDWIYVA